MNEITDQDQKALAEANSTLAFLKLIITKKTKNQNEVNLRTPDSS